MFSLPEPLWHKTPVAAPHTTLFVNSSQAVKRSSEPSLLSLEPDLDEVHRNSKDQLGSSSNTASREEVGVAGGRGGGDGGQGEVIHSEEQGIDESNRHDWVG